jgi:hypothetical protein
MNVTMIKRCAVLTVMLTLSATAAAEPYIAVSKGLQCSACHTGPAGGGQRNAFGNVYAQTELPAAHIGDSDELWTGELLKWLSVGGNLRVGFESVDTPNQPSTSEFNVNRGTVYLQAKIIPDRLSVYIDQQFAPGSSINREAYVRINSASQKFHLLAGQFFLPYGLRLQDDSAFIRQFTGVNFFRPDRGVQVGYESGPWSTMLSLTNGSGGAGDTDTGKQVSAIANYVRSAWRLGASFNFNDSDVGDRQMQNLFAGLHTGPVSWLAEIDLIQDDLPLLGTRDSIAALLEANWLFLQGNNLKLSYDYFDPDTDISADEQSRYSLLWEYTPMQFLQLRIGLRLYDGLPQVDSQNRDEGFVELHGFF